VLCSLIFALIGVTFGAEYMKTKANFIKTCQRKDPQFVACSLKSNQQLYKQLAIGIEGLEDLHFDPMKLKKIEVLGDGGPVSINTTITKATVTGFSNIKIVDIDINPKTYHSVTKLYIPKLRIEGNYEMKGRILVLPINGRGKCWFEPHGLDITLYLKNRLYENFDHKFFNVTGVSLDFNMSGLKLRLNNLFDGAKVLEDSTNEYLNQNWKVVAESLKPVIAKSIENNFLEALNKLYNFIPAEYIISDIPHPSELYGTS